MRRFRPARSHFAVPAAALCLLLLAACEDPSGVGLTVLDPTESDPRARALPAVADATQLDSLQDFTGAFLSSTGFATFRGLAGRVDDPVYGTITASAYLDVLPPQSFPDGFRDRPIEQATLLLRRTYTYGDTTGTTRLDVRQIAEDWDAVDSPSDTLFGVQDGVITSFDVAPGDSLIEVPLPESWIAANDTTLRGDDASTRFHGFRLSPADQASAVYGFAGASSLRLISDEDTVSYRVSELFSGIEPPPAEPLAGDLVRLQDGTGRGLRLAFDVDTLGQAVINTALLRVTADTAATPAPPAGFIRPFARELVLYGFTEDGPPVRITTATLDEETQTFSFSSSVLTDVFQELVLGRSEVEGFLVGFPPAPSSLDVAPLVRSSEPGCEADEAMPCTGPRAVVILIPSDE